MSAVAGQAYAQSNDASAAAEQLFNEGRELASANRWTEACPKFEASLRHDPALGTRLNLATCYEHIGKFARAWGLYHESIDLARQAGDVKRRDYAQTHATALEPRLAKLVITAPVKPSVGFVVRWDGAPIEAGALGAALYADAGPHTLTASAPGFRAFTQATTLVEGRTETLAVPDLTTASLREPDITTSPAEGDAATPELVRVPPPGPQKPASIEPVVAPSSTRTYAAIGLGAAGLATAGVGFLFGAKARSNFGDAKELCVTNLTCTPADYDTGKQLIRDARFNATISTVLVAAGGAAIVTGIVVFLTRPSTHEQRAAQIVPVAHERGAGLALMGRF